MSKQNKTINFLYEASKYLPANDFYSGIRSNMLLKSREINYSHSLCLNLVSRCDTCGVVFKDVPPTRFVKPVKNLNCYRRLENGARNFTKYQILSYKKFKMLKNRKQILVTYCNCCKKQTQQIIKKSGHLRKPKIRPYNRYNVDSARKLKNKHRRRRREYSGLKKSAVLSAKRSLEAEKRNNRSPTRLKIDTNIIDLCTPEVKIKIEKVSTSETDLTLNSNVLTPNTVNIKVEDAGTSLSQNSDVTKPDKKFKNLNDMFTPTFPTNNNNINKTVPEVSDSEVRQIAPRKRKRRKIKRSSDKQYEKIEKTPKIKNNNNIVLVSEHGSPDFKKKKLNNLSNFLKNASNNQKSNQNNTLQNFLSTFS